MLPEKRLDISLVIPGRRGVLLGAARCVARVSPCLHCSHGLPQCNFCGRLPMDCLWELPPPPLYERTSEEAGRER